MRPFLLLISIFLSCNTKSQDHFDICKYRQAQFDIDTCCWRELSRSGSFVQAADLIIQYLKCDSKNKNAHSLKWHAGQMFAAAGLKKDAKHYFHKTYNIFTKWFGGKDGQAWFYYAKGTVAFIDGKKRKLDRIIKKWDKKLPKDTNYKALVKLSENIGKTYREVLLQ
ncbi:MAG: hypothetical protein ABUT20_55635 [Bacteroidota bacterium]